MMTPKAQGYIMPAEWESHSAVWLAWPHDVTTFVQGIAKAELTFCDIIKALEGSERVELMVLNDEMAQKAKQLLKSHGADLNNINFHQVDYVDVWTRDYGLTFLKKDLFVKWNYNVYGKSEEHEIYYKPLLKDNDVFNKLGLPGKKFEPGIVLEGGAIDVDGRGTCLTTEQCLLNPSRNGQMTKAVYEEYLNDYLGVRKTIWLPKGLLNDHTDGHIDEIARFVAPGKIVCAYEDNPEDENFQMLKDNYEILKNSSDAQGQPFELIKLPMPHLIFNDSTLVSDPGQKAPVSYCNFYIGNKVVLASVFNDPNDAKALEIIQSCFPDRKVVPIDCSDIIYGGGAVHCMTQQQPAT